MMMNWYCVHTRPLKEQQVATHFHEMLGLELYFPRLRRQKTIRRVRRVVTSPLFRDTCSAGLILPCAIVPSAMRPT